MPFLTPLRVEKVLFKDIWILLKEFWYHHAPTEYCSEDVTITVPEGFYTDFASVPRIPLVYVACGNMAHEAAVIHDYLYRVDSIPVVSKDTADRIFFDAMIEMGMDDHKAGLMYDGVHLGGSSSYHQKKVGDAL
jgi:hypothetical protein